MGNAPFEMGVNQYTDMTEEEFKQRYIGTGGIRKRKKTGEPITPFSEEEVEKIESQMLKESDIHHLRQTVGSYEIVPVVPNLPDYKNWFAEGKVSKPYNQKNCGSCWAFSAASVMESMAFIEGIDPVL